MRPVACVPPFDAGFVLSESAPYIAQQVRREAQIYDTTNHHTTGPRIAQHFLQDSDLLEIGFGVSRHSSIKKCRSAPSGAFAVDASHVPLPIAARAIDDPFPINRRNCPESQTRSAVDITAPEAVGALLVLAEFDFLPLHEQNGAADSDGCSGKCRREIARAVQQR